MNANAIKLRHQAKGFLHIPENSYADAVRFLGSNDAGFHGIEGAGHFAMHCAPSRSC